MFGIPGDKLVYILPLLILPILPNLWAIVHIFKRDFNTPQEKMIWLGLAVFVPVIGGLAYVFVGRKRAKRC
ncbi:PLD nuclease N-terminal domain-containing protein [Desulfonauticus submarinus]|uniref:Phospholipase_D-nuclease N-terminal n=1 Tax=Desulfonauticus submarinus TaxID=206665 RepID=A0A1H0DY43_9BACT|nr:PLD nuclease N-terminal domain-containing protein [Desulfonauticus submarinus]SDN74946.1 Phospholipase_D-nuclease N-terminal [Desulfonauticus submarinus]